MDRAALEMQQVLAAAMAYNTDHSSGWPVGYACDADQPSDTDHFVENYLPNNSYTSNFGSRFCWGVEPPQNPSSTPRKFWVALPFSSSSQGINLAKRVASLLPFGVALADPTGSVPTSASSDNACDATSTYCYVRAEVVQPAAASANVEKNHIAGVGACSEQVTPSGDPGEQGSTPSIHCKTVSIDKSSKDYGTMNFAVSFLCEAGWQGKVLFVPSNINMGKSGEYHYALNQLTVINNQCTVGADQQTSCSIAVQLAMNKNSANTGVNPFAAGRGGSLGGSYIAYCYNSAASSPHGAML